MSWFKTFREAPTAEHREFDGTLNFTPRAEQVLRLAREEANRLHHHFVGTEHVLLGLLRLGQGPPFTVLEKRGVDPKRVQQEIEEQIGPGLEGTGYGLIGYTPRVKKVLAIAAKEAKAFHHTCVGIEHIFLALLCEGDGVAAVVLKALGLDTELTRQDILEEIDSNYHPTSEDAAMLDEAELLNPQRETIDISKRYDVYCQEGDQEVVYRNALFKGAKTLLPKRDHDVFPEYIELEQANGRTIFIARSTVIKFCEHGITPGSEQVSNPKP